MDRKVRTALETVPLKMLQIDGEPALKKLQERREAHGKVLARAIQIAGLSKKEACAVLGVEANQLSAWLSGNENPQTWRFQQHPQMKRALLAAQAEDMTGVVPMLTFTIPLELPSGKKDTA